MNKFLHQKRRTKSAITSHDAADEIRKPRRLLYILPEHREDAHTHFSYIPPFLDRVGQTLDITLFVEKGFKPNLTHVKEIIRLTPFTFTRVPELFVRMFIERLKGTKVCYVHYSFLSAFIASLIFRTSGGKVFYWNCGLPWLYDRSVARGIFESLVYKMVTYVITGTDKLADHYAEQYLLPRTKVLVMPNWIDVQKTQALAEPENKIAAREKLGLPKDAAVVLFAHRLSERKGAHYLPEIVRNLPENVYLVVLGDGPRRESIENEIEKEGNSKKIIFLGWQPHDSVVKFMSVSDVFIMPSDEEGFPHVLLEALAVGVPFVATGVGGVPEIVPDAMRGMIVAKGDMHDLVVTIKLILLMPKSRLNALSSETEMEVRKYDIERVVDRFLHIIT